MKLVWQMYKPSEPWIALFIEKLTKWTVITSLMIMPILAAMKTDDLRYLWVEIGMTLAAVIVGVKQKDKKTQ